MLNTIFQRKNRQPVSPLCQAHEFPQNQEAFMIEHLDGIFETVNFRDNLGVRINQMDICENFPDHWHTPMEIIRVVENGYQIVVSGRAWQLEEGDIAFLRPGAIHALLAPPEGRRIIYLAELSSVKEIANVETLLSLLPPILVVSGRGFSSFHEKISALLTSIEEEYADPHPFYETVIYGRLLEILGLLGRLDPVLDNRPKDGAAVASPNAERLLSVCSYLNDHCTENLTLETAARLAGFSKFYFTRIFKEFTNVSFTQYLNQKRISLAEGLLANPEYSVTQIALQTGFSSPSAFNRTFRQIKGCSPTRFRRMYSPDCMNVPK